MEHLIICELQIVDFEEGGVAAYPCVFKVDFKVDVVGTFIWILDIISAIWQLQVLVVYLSYVHIVVGSI